MGIGHQFVSDRWSCLSHFVRPGLLFLFSLAWKCRKRLPLVLTIGFLVMDVRMRLEINVINGDDDDVSDNGLSDTDDNEYSSDDFDDDDDEEDDDAEHANF